MSIKKIIQTINKHKSFLLSTHVGPDPDALCSELALGLFLRSIGKKVYIINEETLPERYRFLEKSNFIQPLSKKSKFKAEVMIVLDCGELARIGKVQQLITGKEIIVNLDHHITNDNFGHINFVDPAASSTAEVLYDLIIKAGGQITQTIAKHIYLGIMTDTGSFRYENTTSRTFAIAAQLAKFSFSPHELYQQVYERIPYGDLKNLAAVVSQARVELAGKVIFVVLSKKDLLKFSQNFDLRDAIFKLLRSVKDVEVVAIFTEVSKKLTRVNLRSNRYFDVAKLSSFYSGGGHKRASGCAIHSNLNDACKNLKQRIKIML